MKAEVVEITPELAAELLKRNVKNRTLSPKKLKIYVEDMKNGKWVLNGETIQFNKKGELINGQHRLTAVILSGVTIFVLVVTGVEDERAFATIDQGLMRGAHTVLQLKGVKNAKRMESISKKLMLWDTAEHKENFTTLAGKSFSITAIAEYYEEHKEEIDFIYEQFKDAAILRTCKAYTGVFVALILCYRYSPKETLTFIEKFKTGANLSENNPILLLRNKLTHVTVKDTGRRWELEVMAMIIKSFNNFVTGKTSKLLRWNIENEKFPIPRKKIIEFNREVDQWKAN
jgi:hypothetical protein